MEAPVFLLLRRLGAGSKKEMSRQVTVTYVCVHKPDGMHLWCAGAKRNEMHALGDSLLKERFFIIHTSVHGYGLDASGLSTL